MFYAIVLIVVLMMWLGLNALLAWYPAHPKKISPTNMTLTTTPLEYGLHYEDVLVGNGLSGWFIPSHTARATVILVHGWMSCREEKWVPFLELARHLHEHQMNVLLYDARYVNENKTYSGGQRESVDLINVADWSAKRTGVPVIVWGFSAGGHAALLALSKDDTNIRCAITDSAFVNASESFKSMYRNLYHIPQPLLALLPLFFKLYTGCFPGRLQPRINKPLFVIHGDADSSIHVMNGRILKAIPTTQYWEINGVEHEEAFVKHSAEYTERCISFIDGILGA
ncbi:alpha/beta hydrolase [Alicyclobacillus sp. ALC3]|uniref:alpha/beta hydrolase n=1 Tax=Alicyclobacillus sp. ALC3 TaxID=2796143 RepID=UPI002379FBB9|nr:alpha/beta fold hydrolase [Alicyclobacillus sp. ALC3]WDL97056.1 alpha/beta fold hydrolase [Alicyclobacillus sp. ALC3]